MRRYNDYHVFHAYAHVDKGNGFSFLLMREEKDKDIEYEFDSNYYQGIIIDNCETELVTVNLGNGIEAETIRVIGEPEIKLVTGDKRFITVGKYAGKLTITYEYSDTEQIWTYILNGITIARKG